MPFTGMFNAHRQGMSLTPTHVDHIYYFSVGYGIYDNFYVTTADEELDAVPDEWDWDTVMWAKFNGSLSAGQLDYPLNSINSFRIKRRFKGEPDTAWITMFEVPIETTDDLFFTLYDKYVQWCKTYEYSMVPVVDQVETINITYDVTVDFAGVYITDGTTSYHAIADAYINSYQRNHAGSIIETLASKYPYWIQNGLINYDTGSAEGVFMPLADDGCTLITNGGKCDCTSDKLNETNPFDYRAAVLNFLLNKHAKILKDSGGHVWLCQITGDPQVSVNQNSPYKIKISFNWSQVGDENSQEDLFNEGMIDVAPHITAYDEESSYARA